MPKHRDLSQQNNSRRRIPFLDNIYIVGGGQCRKGYYPFLTSMKVRARIVSGCLPSYQPYWIMVITRSRPYDTSYPLKSRVSIPVDLTAFFCLRSREPFDELKENLNVRSCTFSDFRMLDKFCLYDSKIYHLIFTFLMRKIETEAIKCQI